MQQIPNDGSYFLGDCAGDKCRQSGVLVRRLKLDKNPEGAQIYLCKSDWKYEMRNRFWRNSQGVAEPWDVFDFFEPNPAHKMLVVEQKDEEKPVPFYPVINFAVHGKDSAALYDVHFAFETDEKLSSSIWHEKVAVDVLRQAIEDTRKHMALLNRPHGLVAVFDVHESKEERAARYDFVEDVLESIMINGKGVLTYA